MGNAHIEPKHFKKGLPLVTLIFTVMTTIIVSHYNHNRWEDHRHLLPHPGLPGSSRTTSNLSPPLATFVHSALNYPSICFCAVLMMVLQIIELGKKVSPPWPSAKTSKTSGTCRSIFCPLGLVKFKILHNHGLRLHSLHSFTSSGMHLNSSSLRLILPML